jgi:hypothetical protein
VVEDIASSTACPEVVAGDTGQVQSVIKLSEGQQSGVGDDGGTVKVQADFGVELEPQRGFSPSPVECLQDAYAIYVKLATLWGDYSHTDGQHLTN